MTTRTDYVLTDVTSANWPGSLPYRGPWTAPGRGYRTYADAQRRARRIANHAAATLGSAGPDLRVVEREVRES